MEIEIRADAEKRGARKKTPTGEVCGRLAARGVIGAESE